MRAFHHYIGPVMRKRLVLGFAAIAFMLPRPLEALAQGQLLDQLKGAVGSGGGLGGGLPSVDQASPGNTAGVLQYCIQNNYLSGGSASSVKDTLLGKVTGSSHPSAVSDPGFASGSKGMLETGNGQGFSLSGGGLKGQLVRKACDMVLQHAKSLL